MSRNAKKNLQGSLMDLFAQAARRFGDKTALRFMARSCTYAELDRLTDCMAARLMALGVRPGGTAAIFLEKSDLAVMAMLAVMKCGAAYVPLGAVYPIQRINEMIKISGADTVIVSERDERLIVQNQVEAEALVGDGGAENVGGLRHPDGLAYVMFTSGSTGNPKGVAIGSDSIVNLVCEMRSQLKGQAIQVVAVNAPLVFDVSVGQIYYALLSGHTLCVLPDRVKESAADYLLFLEKERVDVLDITPTYLQILVEALESESRRFPFPGVVISAGEALGMPLARRFFQCAEDLNGQLLINAYGPTEACVYATFFQITHQRLQTMTRMLIGKPVVNARIFVLDSDQKPCQPESEGEMYISGACLARGYINAPELTSAAFVRTGHTGKTVLYRTGDIVRETPDGQLEYLGRRDSQVKLRGQRIELGEIESRLMSAEGVKNCRVLCRDTGNGKAAVAYFSSDSMLTLEFLLAHLGRTLPAYMLPDYFVPVKAFPEGNTGKLDVSRLPDFREHALRGVAVSSVAPAGHTGEVGRRVLEICESILECRNISLSESFVHLGGNSLSFFILANRLCREWGVSMRTGDLSRCKTIGDIAALVGQALQTGDVDQRQEGHAPGSIPVTENQKYMLKMKRQLDKRAKALGLGGEPSFNLLYLVSFGKKLDPDRLCLALEAVIERHAMLRAVFEKVNGNYVMRRHERGVNPFVYRHCEKITKEQAKLLVEDFSLEALPLFRVVLLEDRAGGQKLLLNFHHAIFDYNSLLPFLDDLLAGYAGMELGAPHNGFYQYAELNAPGIGPETKSFWNRYLLNRKPAVCFKALPPSRTAGLSPSYTAQKVQLELPSGIRKALAGFCRLHGCTEYEVMLTALSLLLYLRRGEPDCVIGTNAGGRVGGGMGDIVGMFTTTICARFHCDEHKTLLEFVLAGRENIQDMLRHQEASQLAIYHSMSMEELSLGPLYEVFFNYLGFDDLVLPSTGQKAEIRELDEEPLLVPYHIKATASGGNIEFEASFAADLFSAGEALDVLRQYIELIGTIVGHSGIQVSQLQSEALERSA